MKKPNQLPIDPKTPEPVGLHAVVRPRSPWHQWDDRAAKLKAARAIAARRREIKWHRENELDLLRNRNRQRLKYGIPLELPKMKPHQYKKNLLA